MVAVLEPIKAQVIAPASYDNTYLGWEADWIVSNRDALMARWHECELHLGESLPDADFKIFCQAQHDIQLARREEFKRTLRQY